MKYEIKEDIVFNPFEIIIKVENNEEAIKLRQLFDRPKNGDDFDLKINYICDEIEKYMK